MTAQDRPADGAEERCNAPSVTGTPPCVRRPGHDGDHGYGGIFWPAAEDDAAEKAVRHVLSSHGIEEDIFEGEGATVGYANLVSDLHAAALDAAGVPALRAEVENLCEQMHDQVERHGHALARAEAAEAEVERLREAYNHRTTECQRWQAEQGRLIFERDEARRQVADLRARIEALADSITAKCLSAHHAQEWSNHGYCYTDTLCRACGDTQRTLRALLPESGEQPGDPNPDASLWGYRAAQRPAPVVLDSTDLPWRVEVAVARTIAQHGLTGIAEGLEDDIRDAVLAVVRPDGVSAAQAWDEGRAAGIADVDTTGYGGITDTPNPYRTDSPAGGAL